LSFIPGLPPQRNQPSLRHHFAPAVPQNPGAAPHTGSHIDKPGAEPPAANPPQLVEEEQTPTVQVEFKPPKDLGANAHPLKGGAQGFQFSWSQGGQKGFDGHQGARFRQMQERDLERYGRNRKNKEQGGQDSPQEQENKEQGQQAAQLVEAKEDLTLRTVLVADEPGFGLVFGQENLLTSQGPFCAPSVLNDSNWLANDVILHTPEVLPDLPEPWSLLIPEQELRRLAGPLVAAFEGLPETMLWSCYHAGVRFEPAARSGYDQDSRCIRLEVGVFSAGGDLALRLLCQAFDHFLGNDHYASQTSLAVLAAKPPEIGAQEFFIDQMLAWRRPDKGALADYLDYLFQSLMQKKPEAEWLLHEG
jgi:hypothetical protein